MFVVSLTYIAPLETIDALIPAHSDWLKSQYAAGIFIASGRKVPRTGGVILARGVGRTELEAVLAQDPFSLAGAAQYEIIEFVPTMTAPAIDHLREPLPQ